MLPVIGIAGAGIISSHWIKAGLLTAAASASGALMGAEVSDRQSFSVMGLVVVWGADQADPSANVPIVSDFVIDSGIGNTAATSGDLDLISGDVHTVVTGSLVPVSNDVASQQGAPMIIRNPVGQGNFRTDTNNDRVMDASDSFGAFQIGNNTDTNTRRMEIFSSFYVASNVAFSIDGQATALNGTTAAQMNRIRLRLRVTESGNDGLAFGSAAQFPHTAGAAGGSQANNRRLSTMTTARRVFRGNRRTAAVRGTLAEQSVRFDARYQYRSGNVDLSDGAFDAEAEVVYTVYVP